MFTIQKMVASIPFLESLAREKRIVLLFKEQHKVRKRLKRKLWQINKISQNKLLFINMGLWIAVLVLFVMKIMILKINHLNH